MKNFFVKNSRKLLVSLSGIALMVALNLAVGGQLALFPAYLAGYFLAAAYFFTVASRLNRAAHKEKAAAKREMLIGMLLRLIMLFVVFGAALKISLSVFMTVIAGFGVFHVVFLAHLIIAVFRLNVLSEDEAENPPTLSTVKEV